MDPRRAQLLRFETWARHGRPYPGPAPRLSRDYDRVWDRLETAYALRRETALWWEEGYAEAQRQRERAAAEERERLDRARITKALLEHAGLGRGGDQFGRASAYLARAEGGSSGDGRNPKAWGVVLRVVRGFALSETVAMELLELEYAPRCRPTLPRRELHGMVRRALRASFPAWGYLLER